MSTLVEKHRDFFRDAKTVCEHWWADKLDCRVSFARQLIKDAVFEECLLRITEETFINVMFRNTPGENYLEVSYRTLHGPAVDYFLWLVIPLERAQEFLSRHPDYKVR